MEMKHSKEEVLKAIGNLENIDENSDIKDIKRDVTILLDYVINLLDLFKISRQNELKMQNKLLEYMTTHMPTRNKIKIKKRTK